VQDVPLKKYPTAQMLTQEDPLKAVPLVQFKILVQFPLYKEVLFGHEQAPFKYIIPPVQ
jgi:hypothetical protein